MSSDGPLDEVFMSCKSLLARVVSKLVPPHDIEDIVQETYVRVCKFQAKNEVQNQRALMVTTARNLALDHIKRAEWRLASSLEELEQPNIDALISDIDAPCTQAASDEEFARFCEIVRTLPQQCRRVFVLKKVYGYSQKEIAEQLGLSESTVEKHIAKGMKHCAQQMLNKTDKRQHKMRRQGGQR
jgi:RNA polymerase sigma-70 factor (ECF subfamily)